MYFKLSPGEGEDAVTGNRVYNRDKALGIALTVSELGQIMSGVPPGGLAFFRDPKLMKVAVPSSTEQKRMTIKRNEQGEGYFLNLVQGTQQLYLKLEEGEFQVIKALVPPAINKALGFCDSVTDDQIRAQVARAGNGGWQA
eukprot:augustus_masked-scaffold_2-processed-gene-23.13-mRNA-1 protein AED:1.00 eAED:1.00 QI:0/-1/0/0/-1/1/1/0/140